MTGVGGGCAPVKDDGRNVWWIAVTFSEVSSGHPLERDLTWTSFCASRPTQQRGNCQEAETRSLMCQHHLDIGTVLITLRLETCTHMLRASTSPVMTSFLSLRMSTSFIGFHQISIVRI